MLGTTRAKLNEGEANVADLFNAGRLVPMAAFAALSNLYSKDD